MTADDLMIDANQGTVGFKAWRPLPAGGSVTIDLTLPVGFTDDDLARALEDWRRMQGPALAALDSVVGNISTPAASRGNPDQVASYDPGSFVFPFGKHKGQTVADVHQRGPRGRDGRSYVEWAAEAIQDPAVRDACRAYLAALPAKARPAGDPGPQDPGQDADIPF